MGHAVAAERNTYAETNYANPHALTGFFNGSATTTYSYDAIGNLATTTGAATSSFNWDYRSRMVRAWVSGATSTYAYDHTTQRMRQVVGSTTTDYPNKFYQLATTTITAATSTATSTAYIWHGDTLVATIEQALINGVASGTATTYYVHPDHLGSTNVITNSAGVVKQALDYYPYGAQRINTGTDASDRRFIGQFGDDATSLSYLNARYYDPARGQFTSQDPVFWEIGQTDDGKAVLQLPQLQNSYSYAGSNPIKEKDPQGRLIDTIADIGFIGYDLYRVGQAYYNGGDVRAELGYLGLDVAGAATPFGTGFGLAARATAKAANNAEKTYQIYAKTKKAADGADEVYVGRTSGKRSPEGNVVARDASHHRTAEGFGPAQHLVTTNTYGAARGLEQMAQNYTQSLGRLTQQIRGISPSNPNLGSYLQAAQKQVNEIQKAINKLMGK